MSIYNTIKLFATVILFVGISSCTIKKKIKEKKPNIIYFLVDDMGWGDLSIYGQKCFKTPNIDKLASEGMSFTNHYTGSPVSGPSRACLMTGKHTGHVSVRGNYPEPQLLDDTEVTLASVLKPAGYATAMIGKWGIGSPIPLNDPNKKGFDYYYGYLDMYHAHNCFPEFLYRNGVKEILFGNKLRLDEKGNNPWAHMPKGVGVAAHDSRHTYAPDLFLNEALKYIEEHRKNTFFLYYSLNLPHANNEAGDWGCETPKIDNDIASTDWPEAEKGFAQMMRIIDNQVGCIVAKLKELGLEENTVFMFASDNGPHQEGGHRVDFFDSNAFMRGMKRDMYEGGIRTPFIVKWPARIKAASENDVLSAFWDILPTFCDIAKLDIPDGIDGVSLFPTLIGLDGQQLHKYLYFEFYEEGGKQAVVTKDWKYVKLNVTQFEGAEPMRSELYKLDMDRSETEDLAKEYPEIVDMMENCIDESHTPFALIELY